MQLHEFTKEELLSSIIRLLRSGVCLDHASEYADMLQDGSWMEEAIWEAIEYNERAIWEAIEYNESLKL